MNATRRPTFFATDVEDITAFLIMVNAIVAMIIYRRAARENGAALKRPLAR